MLNHVTLYARARVNPGHTSETKANYSDGKQTQERRPQMNLKYSHPEPTDKRNVKLRHV
jgi:hypothetical protein